MRSLDMPPSPEFSGDTDTLTRENHRADELLKALDAEIIKSKQLRGGLSGAVFEALKREDAAVEASRIVPLSELVQGSPKNMDEHRTGADYK